MYQVHIERDFASNRLRFFLIERVNHRSLLHRADGIVKEIMPAEMIDRDMGSAVLTIPDDAAPALLAELARHLGAVEYPEQLRRDYEHERGRVDRLIDHLMERKR